MIDLLNILTHFEQDGRGLLFFKDGTRSGVAAAIRLNMGINHLYMSEQEMNVQYRNLVDVLSSLPTFGGKRGMLYQFYVVPSFEFADITEEMENLCTNDNDFRMIYKALIEEKIGQIRKFAGDKKILRYNLFLIARYFTKGGFVPDLLHALKADLL